MIRKRTKEDEDLPRKLENMDVMALPCRASVG
jgi:hypothetical protein